MLQDGTDAGGLILTNRHVAEPWWNNAAAAGLDAWGVSPADRDRYLGVIEGRCRRGITGAAWQTRFYHRALARGTDRAPALSELVRRYCELARTGQPVHSWPD